ncbi:MAG: hypothetical protein LBK57_01955 [Clostridiales Family XIII bacterium]|jgi:hypothetical protein|nr:hypothetical protein [Clostridiales Family XIII bacterium]
MADYGVLGGISSLYGYGSQMRSLYGLERNNSTLFKAITEAAKTTGNSSLFGTGALESIADGSFASAWNDKTLKGTGADSASLNYMKGIKSGAKELKAALSSAPQSTNAGGEDAEKNIKEIVGGVNKLLSAVYENVGKGSERLFNDIVGAVSTYAPALDRIGVSMGSEGLLKINEDKLKSASENGEIDKFVNKTSSSNYGFMSKMSKVVSNVETNPAYYTNAGGAAVNNTGYYSNQSYNALSNIGLLMNYLV